MQVIKRLAVAGSAALVVVLVAGATSAQAEPCVGSLCVLEETDASVASGWLNVEGGSGNSSIVVTYQSSGVYTVTDTLGVSPGSGCTRPSLLDTATVRCSGVSTNSMMVTGGSGNDRIEARVAGSQARVYLSGNSTTNHLSNGPSDGANTLIADGGSYIDMYGGGGNDVFFGGSASCGGCPGQDWLDAGPGSDQVFGGSRAENISGPGYGNDVLRGGGGNDSLYDQEGSDTVYGDSGNDSIDVKDSSGGDWADCGLGTDSILRDSTDSWFNCETVG